MQLADVQSRARETAFNPADAALEIADFDFDVDAHAAALAQLRRSCSNEPQRFCAAYRKAGDQIAIDTSTPNAAPAARPTSRRPPSCYPHGGVTAQYSRLGCLTDGRGSAYT
jgi:hypothetical protein